MPIFLEFLTAFLLITVGFFLISNSRRTKREMLKKQEEEQQLLQHKFTIIEDKLSAFEKRLANMELIVTDTQFIDPPTSGREAIDLKSEITELKSILLNMKK